MGRGSTGVSSDGRGDRELLGAAVEVTGGGGALLGAAVVVAGAGRAAAAGAGADRVRVDVPAAGAVRECVTGGGLR
jgi:hypothetical protein